MDEQGKSAGKGIKSKKTLGIAVALIVLIAIAWVYVPTLTKKEAPTTYIGAKYVGSEECRDCHDRIYAGWKETLHARVIQDAKKNPEAILGDFRHGATVKAKPGEYVALPIAKEDVYLTHGSDRKQRYITLKDGKYLILPPQYNPETGEWVPSPYWKDWFDGKPKDWVENCAYCHTVGYDVEKKTFAELSVGCESCHGPGGNHVDAAKIDPVKALGTIINPALLTADASAQICGQCHNRGKSPDGKYEFPAGYMPGRNINLYFVQKPGLWIDNTTSKSHRQQYIDWATSAHAKGGITCATCHTVHSSANKFQTKAPGYVLCTNCHLAKIDDKHQEPCKSANCLGCHMPQMIRTSGDERERLHTFKVITPDVSVKLGGVAKMPNSCNLCHTHEKDAPEKLWEAMAKAGRKVPPLPTPAPAPK